MDDLLTSKQVQDLLKIERITVYRMLNDHRLQGIKIGKQWRFPASQFENMQSLDKPSTAIMPPNTLSPFPVHCMQTIQNLISDLREIATLIIDTDGNPLTDTKNYCKFCQVIKDEDEGELACLASWKRVAAVKKQAGWMHCHAGMAYYFHELQENGKSIAYLLAGQFKIAADDQHSHLKDYLTNMLEIDEHQISALVEDVPVLDAASQKQIEKWVHSAAVALEEIFIERTDLLKRLQQIAQISQITS
ncbi:MAG: PocR ligand-binding domain-containing protein [Anaerolineaceae bacterium]|nr:PocR ligand-binding domain-containing protein [Anaerolineaceae bacterium]